MDANRISARAHQVLHALLTIHVLFATQFGMAQVKAPPAPPPPPPTTNPPTPPTGPLPWRVGNKDERFFTEKEKIKETLERSTSPKSLLLEDYRRSAESSLQDLEQSRQEGLIDKSAYRTQLDKYRQSIRLYQELRSTK